VTGKIYLTIPLEPLAPRTGIGFSYRKNEDPQYPTPSIPVNFSKYEYHTYTMELLPHEAHFLVDGFVKLRYPDRLIPKNDFRYDYVTSTPRTPFHIQPGAMYFHGDAGVFAAQKLSFDMYKDSLSHGCWPINGHSAAHHLIDYVKVWDVPSDMRLPDFPQ
jgi:hypothetical protein